MHCLCLLPATIPMFGFAYYSIVKSFYLEQSSLVYIIYDYNPFFYEIRTMLLYTAGLVHNTILYKNVLGFIRTKINVSGRVSAYILPLASSSTLL